MPCYKPLMALIRQDPSKSGTGSKKTVTFPKGVPSADVARHGTPTPLPCGQCVGCRLERSRQWAIRLTKELKLHDRSAFLTLTYDDEHLPRLPNGTPTLVLEDIQKFLKRLRKDQGLNKIRFFQCGEYGELTKRPHHHMILFGTAFDKDRKPTHASRSGFPQYESESLNKLWGKGNCTISEVTFESAAYCARYILKKITGKGSRFFYNGRKPEFVTMSRRPGIGSAYFDEYKDDMYPNDLIIPDIGRPESLPPKYFDRLLEKVDKPLFDKVKKNRTEGLDFWTDKNSTDTRLATRERLVERLIKNCLPRKIE